MPTPQVGLLTGADHVAPWERSEEHRLIPEERFHNDEGPGR